MNTKLSLFNVAGFLSMAAVSFAQGTAFSYQGRLNDNGPPANGNYGMVFYLCNTPDTGGQLANLGIANVPVSNGLFTVTLDFGANFPGADRWLEITVKTNSAATFTTLSPRQKLTPTPYAIHAANAKLLDGQSANNYVAKSGDTMTGRLNLPVDGLVTGGKQLVVASGNVGIGTASPQAKLDVDGDLLVGSLITGRDRLHIQSNERLYLNPAGDGRDVYVGGSPAGSPANLIVIRGSIGIGTETPQTKLQVIGPDAVVETGWKSEFFSGYAGNYPSQRVGFGYDASGSTFGAALMTEGMTRLWAGNNGNVGIGTTSPQAKLHVVGDLRTSVLSITGGSDVAEPFPMSTADIPKGAVVIIDEEHPGQLKLSCAPYDSRVAGIVSGAGGVNPGLTLSQEGTLAGGHNVALSGRVYAQADATAAPIKPGDLLTTSSTPGHCMKATDRERAPGAILGKAMSTLKEGKGLVLVLVSLQ